MIKKLQAYTPYFLGLSAILLSLLVPGGPIENRNFSHLFPVVALSFNIFLTMLGLASFPLIYFIVKKQEWAFKTSFVFGIFYVSIYLLDLAKIFPVSPDKMSPLLCTIEIIGTIMGFLLLFSSNSYLNETNKKKKECKKINKVMLLVFILSFIIIGIIIVIFATHSALEPNSEDELDNIIGIHPIQAHSYNTSSVLPEGYTFDSYSVEKITNITCANDSDCETPVDYLVQSRCPFTSLCIENKCLIVCPDIKTKALQGKIIMIKPEMDGSIITIKDGETTYEVLVSIPNLGEGYASSIGDIKVGKYIQVIGNIIKLKDSERIIASQIYVEGTFTGEHPCNLEPDAGSCKAAMPRYFFDKEKEKCKEFLWGGCDGTVPFDNLDVCRSTCERVIPDKPELTTHLCESDGGRVVNTLNDACNKDEIDIGNINSEYICCMITGDMGMNER